MASFIKNVTILSIGTALAQAVSIISIPVLSRLFPPEAFGVAAVFASVSGIGGIISCLRYDLAIMLPKEEKDAASVFFLSLIFVFLVSGVFFIVLWQGRDFFAALFHWKMLHNYIWLIILMIFLTGVWSAFNFWLSRKKKWVRLSVSNAAESISNYGSKIFFGFSGFNGGLFLIAGNILGRMAAVFLMLPRVLKDLKEIGSDITLKRLYVALYRYKDFPLFNLWSATLISLSAEIPVLVLTGFFSASIVGYFSLARSILRMPITLIGSSVAQVYFQKAAEIVYEKNKLANVTENIFTVLFAIIFFPLLLIFLTGEDIFRFVLGSQWASAGRIAQLFCLSIIVEFVTAPLSNLYSVLEKQRQGLCFDILMISIRISFIYFGCLSGDYLFAIALFTIGDIVGRMLKFYWIFNFIGFSPRRIIHAIYKPICISIIMFLAFFVLQRMLHIKDLFVFFCYLIVVLGYFVVSYLTTSVLRRYIKGL